MTEIHPTDAEIAESIDRISRTPDGANLYVLLQRRVMRVLGVAEPGALQSDNGERMFATHLMSLMAKGIYESGGRTSSTGGTGPDSEQPFVVPRAEPVRTGRARNPGGRRITADTIVPGWNDDPAG